MSDYDIGYKKPPKDTRFRKGQSGNPAGRRKKEKAPPDRSLAAMLKRIGEKEVEFGGETYTLQELELHALHRKAAKGDVAASRHLAKMRGEAGLLKPEERRTGVLAIPMTVDDDTWEYMAAKQQAQYRGDGPTELDSVVHDPTCKEPYMAFDALKKR